MDTDAFLIDREDIEDRMGRRRMAAAQRAAEGPSLFGFHLWPAASALLGSSAGLWKLAGPLLAPLLVRFLTKKFRRTSWIEATLSQVVASLFPTSGSR